MKKILILVMALILLGNGCETLPSYNFDEPIPENYTKWQNSYSHIIRQDGVYVTIHSKGKCLDTN